MGVGQLRSQKGGWVVLKVHKARLNQPPPVARGPPGPPSWGGRGWVVCAWVTSVGQSAWVVHCASDQVWCGGRLPIMAHSGYCAHYYSRGLGSCPWLSWGLVAELPSNLARGLSGRRDFGPRMGGTLSTQSTHSTLTTRASISRFRGF